MAARIRPDNNFFFLTAALVVLLLCGSLDQLIPEGWLEDALQIFTLLTFVTCLQSLKFAPQWRQFLRVLLGLWLVLAILGRFLDLGLADLFGMGLMLLFFTGTLKATASQILFTGAITPNKVVGSLALFLLLGLIWALLYLLILEVTPEAFNGMEALPWQANFNTAAYFSFVTLTTLGFGEITPANALARTAVYLEAIAGVFYLAIVVASLVSASQSEPDKPQAPE